VKQPGHAVTLSDADANPRKTLILIASAANVGVPVLNFVVVHLNLLYHLNYII